MVSYTNLRMVVIGVIYPAYLPPYSTVFWHYKQWRSQGVIENIRDVLQAQVRQQVKKKRSGTTLIIIDSQAVKNTCNASIKSKGFCFYKSTNGIKRHLAVDSLGFPFFTHCTKASVSDDVGLIEMISNNIEYFKSKPVNIPKITILLDNGYHPEKIIEELKKIYPAIMTKIRFKLSPKPSLLEKENLGKKGFVPVKARWVIERTNSWMDRCKSLTKNFVCVCVASRREAFRRKRTLENATAKINMCFIRLMLKRLAIA